MSDGELLGIGHVAMLAGLSIPGLRHYDEVGVLKPARVDPQSGYRYYRPRQVREARLLHALRGIDLPIDEIKVVLGAGDQDQVRMVLLKHRHRLSERAHALTEQMATLEEFIERGVFVAGPTGNRIALLNIAVDELAQSRRFYEALLGIEFAEECHGDGPVHLNATFGEWNTPSWFLLSLWPNPDRAGTVDIGFLVEDLAATYERALAAGATDVFGPRNIEGMPRTAQIRDPSGNDIGLYQS